LLSTSLILFAGNPKGATLLHRNLIADMSAAQLIFEGVRGLEKLTNDDSLIR
jgi:hypothetical protein